MRHNPRAVATAILLAAAMAGPVGSPLAAQTVGSVRGKVTNAATLRPVTDAQVYVAGTQRGTLTNANGDFLILNVPVGEVTIRVQMLGFTQAEQVVNVQPGDAAVANFAISQSAIELGEIVVTGTPGATSKKALGNSITKLDVAQVLESAPLKTVEEVLYGRAPGVTLMAGAGTSGTASNIRIRGASTINAGVQPIFYVDGVRIQGSLDAADFSVLGQDRSPLNHINPEDIESIEIVKGPAAATLYGAEAATGVVQIITKKGRTGQQDMQWTVRAETGDINWTLDQPLSYKTCTESMIGSSTWPGCKGVQPGHMIVQRTLADHDQTITFASGEQMVIPQGIREGRSEAYNLSVRGGGDRYSFFGSADQDFERGVFFNNFFKRQSGRLNFQILPTDRIEATTSIGYSRNNTQLPLNDNASNGLLRNAYRGEPGRTPPWEYGYLNLGPGQINTWMNFTEEERFILSNTVNYRPTGWFNSRLTLGLDRLAVTAIETTPIDTTGRSPFGSTRAGGYIERQETSNHVWTVDWAGTVEYDVNDRWSTATSVGMQYQPRRFHQIWGSGEGLISNRLNLLRSAAITQSWEDESEQNSLGVYVQEQVGWRDVLFLTAGVRFDDNSAFGAEFDLATYPKVSASYVITDEDYFDVAWVDQLKLRLAFGKAGNAPAPFSADRTLTATTATADDGTSVTAITTDDYGNPSLKAEEGQEWELGFDAGLLGNRAGVEATYYLKHTRDALIQIPAPPSSGFTGNIWQNLGEIRNEGIELAVWGTPVARRNVSWDVRTSFAWNSNEVVEMGRDPIKFGSFRTVQQHKEGFPLGGYWAWDVARDGAGNPVLDANGRATVLDDTTFVGPSAPTREIGLTNTVTLFNNLRVFAFLDYKGGHYLWSAREWWRSVNQNISEYVNDPKYSDAEKAMYGSGAPRPFIDNADFLKLREVSLTYTLPVRYAEVFGARTASFSLAGRNLWLWTKYDLGSDPEVNFSGNASFSRTDYMSVPMFRRLSASVTLGF